MRKMEKDAFTRACSDRTRGSGFNLRECPFRLHIRKKFFYSEGAQALEQVAQRSRGRPITGSVQGQVGKGFEWPDLVKDVPAHGRWVGLDDLQSTFPSQTMIRWS